MAGEYHESAADERREGAAHERHESHYDRMGESIAHHLGNAHRAIKERLNRAHIHED